MTKYRGLAIDRMGTLETKKTKWYGTYKEAHDAAKKLAKKHFTDGRYEIDIEQK